MKCPHCGKDTKLSPEMLESIARVRKLMKKAIVKVKRVRIKEKND